MDAMVEEQPNQMPEEVQVPETDDEVLSRLDGALKGAMVLEKPRVSKKVRLHAWIMHHIVVHGYRCSSKYQYADI
jgi:hypothetical protein